MDVGYLIDIDGVVKIEDEPIPSGVSFVRSLLDNDVPFLFITNNATRTVGENVSLLRRLGMPIGPEHVVTSGLVTAEHIAETAPDARVYAIGEQGLRDTLASKGVMLTDDDPTHVVVALDWSFSYDKMRRATRAVREGATFIATNIDRTFPSAEGLIPGAGALVASIEAATDVTPMSMGKPYAPIFSYSLSRLGLPRESVYMIGDRIDTDINGARDAGIRSILVLSGVTTREMLHGDEPYDICIDSLDELSWRCPV